VKKDNQNLYYQLGKGEQEKQQEIRTLKASHDSVVQELQRQINARVTGNPQVSEDLQQ
jgi:hypothetical protein